MICIAGAEVAGVSKLFLKITRVSCFSDISISRRPRQDQLSWGNTASPSSKQVKRTCCLGSPSKILLSCSRQVRALERSQVTRYIHPGGHQILRTTTAYRQRFMKQRHRAVSTCCLLVGGCFFFFFFFLLFQRVSSFVLPRSIKTIYDVNFLTSMPDGLNDL